MDISAGWGDRLITSILFGMEYTGYDPNPLLIDCYNNIINDTLTLDELDTNSIEESYKQENISISKIENDYNTILHIKENNL